MVVLGDLYTFCNENAGRINGFYESLQSFRFLNTFLMSF